MSNTNIDVNELIGLLNAQIAGQNLELHVAKLQISNLTKQVEELSKKLGQASGESPAKNKTR